VGTRTPSKFYTSTTPSPHPQIIEFHIEIWPTDAELLN
jgi:hypothetical protein